MGKTPDVSYKDVLSLFVFIYYVVDFEPVPMWSILNRFAWGNRRCVIFSNGENLNNSVPGAGK